jgi:hypothetical protein
VQDCPSEPGPEAAKFPYVSGGDSLVINGWRGSDGQVTDVGPHGAPIRRSTASAFSGHPGRAGNPALIRIANALAALEIYRGDTYDLECSAGVWQARYRDGSGSVLTACDPAGLCRVLAAQAQP